MYKSFIRKISVLLLLILCVPFIGHTSFDDDMFIMDDQPSVEVSPKKVIPEEKVEAVTGDKKEYVTIYSPYDKFTTNKNIILVKGMFLKNGEIKVNQRNIDLKAGRFYTKYSLNKIGKNLLKFRFIDKFNEVEKTRRVLLLKTFNDIPVEHRLYKPIRDLATLDILPGSRDDIYGLKKRLTRGELAKVLISLKGINTSKANRKIFIDVPSEYKYSAYINAAFENDLISGYPDGTFRPNAYVNRAQMVVLLVKISGVSLDGKVAKDIFRDISKRHWAYKYIVAAIEAKIISKANLFYPNQYVTRGMLVDFLRKTPIVTKLVKNLYDFNLGYGVVTKVATINESKKLEVKPQLVSVKEESFMKDPSLLGPAEMSDLFPDVKVYSPSVKQTVIKDTVFIKGRISKQKRHKIFVNDKKIRVARNGRFIYKLKVPYGKSRIIIGVNDKKFEYAVNRLKVYSDVSKKHWAFSFITKMFAYGYLVPVDEFKPDEALTREEFAYTMSKIFKLEDSQNNIKDVLDVDSSNKYLKEINSVLSNDIMFLEDGLFQPSKTITRAEVVLFLSRMYDVSAGIEKAPFVDVPLSHYAVDEIAFFKKMDIISPARNFKPDSNISRAQFAALISRLPEVQSQMKDSNSW